MKCKSFISVIVFVLLFSCSGRELSRQAEKETAKTPEPYPTQSIMHFMYGEIYRSSGNFAYANMEYQRALNYDTSTTILNAIAETYLIMGKKDMAREYFEKTLYYDPENPAANTAVINLYLEEGRYDKAIPLLERELEQKADDSELLRKLASAYRRSKKFDAALEVLDRMIRLEPGLPWPYIYTAEIELERGQLANAAPYLEKAVLLLPPDNELYEFLIRALIEKNDMPALISALESWMKSDPDILLPYLFYIEQQIRLNNISAADSVLAEIRTQSSADYRIPYLEGTLAMLNNDEDSAWAYYQKATAFPEADRNVFMRFGLWFWENGKFERAAMIAESAIARFGREARWLHMLAMLRFGTGNTEEAKTLLHEVVSADPQNRGAREDLANIFLQEGNATAADSIYAGLLNETPENPSLLNNYAYSLAQMNIRLDAAMEMVNKALEYDKNAAYCDTKAWIYYRKKQYRRALRWVKKSLKYEDAGSEVHYHHGKIRSALNQKTAAESAFKEALAINPANSEAREALEELGI